MLGLSDAGVQIMFSVESGIQGFGTSIQSVESGMLLSTGIQNPLREVSPEFRTVFDYLGPRCLVGKWLPKHIYYYNFIIFILKLTFSFFVMTANLIISSSLSLTK